MLCSLCLINSTEVLNIFDGDGERLKIANIIGQHFWSVPIKYDKKSHICCTCWLKVDEFHQFYCFIKDAQKKLSEILLTDQKSTQQTSRTYLKKENNDDSDECIYDTGFNGYVNMIQDNNENEHIEIKSEICDSNESRHDKFEDGKDPIYTDNTNLNKELDSEIKKKICGNDKSIKRSKIKTSSKTKFKKNVKQKRGGQKKRPPNISNIEEDLPLKYIIKQKSLRDSECSEKLKKSKEKDDVIANYMKLKCEICGKEFTTFVEIDQHCRQIHNTKGYVVCCNKKLYRKYLLFDHINIHLNPEYFKCDECKKIFSDKECLRKHISRHKSKYECDQCYKKFPKEHLLIRHKFIHVPLEERQFKCDDCGKAFSTKHILQEHHLKIHQNAYGKMCHICAKVIIGRSKFEKHQLEHAGIVEPKVKCEKCGAWLKDKSNLKKHMNLHIDRLNTHKCEICGKISPTKVALRCHIRYVHESERTYQCGICDKSFKRAVRLKEHMATHTGEILYTCPHCPKTFKCSANLHAHRKKKHRKDWEESRKDRGVSENVISDVRFEDNENSNKDFSKEDNIENNSHELK